MAAPTCNFCRAREKYHQAPFQQFEIKRAWLLITVGGGSWQTHFTRLQCVNLEPWLAEPELTYAKHEGCLSKHGLREHAQARTSHQHLLPPAAFQLELLA